MMVLLVVPILLLALCVLFCLCVWHDRLFLWPWLALVVAAALTTVFFSFTGSLLAGHETKPQMAYQREFRYFLAECCEAATWEVALRRVEEGLTDGRWLARIDRTLPADRGKYLIFAGYGVLGIALAAAFIRDRRPRLAVAGLGLVVGLLCLGAGSFQNKIREGRKARMLEEYHLMLRELGNLTALSISSGLTPHQFAVQLRHGTSGEITHEQP